MEGKFSELGSLEFSRAGFEENSRGLFVTKFETGVAFTVRYDEKIIPASVTNAEAKKRIAEKETTEDRRVAKKERNEIREQVFTEFLAKALTATKRLTCFYRREDRLLVIPTGSKKLANIVVSKLLKVIGSIRFESIHVTEEKHGLTKKLSDYLDGEYIFYHFSVGGRCKLKTDDKLKFAFDLDDLGNAKDGIQEAISSGAKIKEIGLFNDDIDFRIDDDFVIKGIHFIDDGSEPQEFEDYEDAWAHEAGTQLLLFANAFNKLVELFQYDETEHAQ
jgi:recombination associated protein RdgC